MSNHQEEILSAEEKKCLNGEFYDFKDPGLRKKRLFSEEQFYKLNKTFGPERNEILKQTLFHIGENVTIDLPFDCYYGRHTIIGDNVYINSHCSFYDDGFISIGSNTFCGPSLQIYTSVHPIKKSERNKPGSDRSLSVSVGKDVWIGGNVTIFPGVTIGDGCVIGAGSLVTKSMPPNSKCFGFPCKVQSYILND